ncbi:MAG: hypothetical protein HRS50_00160 [Mycoplasmataceae bacterium]|nr:hypothetical protein [Mycoplasmataceae bacterium]
MGSLYKLITKTNLKSPAIAFPLIMPLVFILLYSVGIEDGLDSASMDAIVASFLITTLSIQTMNSGLMGFGINFMSIKKSVLLRRIGATKLRKLDVIIAVLLYGLTMWLITFVWIFILIIVFNMSGLFYSLNSKEHILTTGIASFFTLIEWPKLIAALIIMLIVSYSFSLFIVSITHNETTYQAIIMFYFFTASFMGGMIFPGEIPEWMNIVGYLIPHAYAGELFDWTIGEEIPTTKLVFDFIVPIIFTTACMFGAVKLLKFD